MGGNPKILITGATGVIGEALVERLLSSRYNVAVVVQNLEKSLQLFSDRVTHIHFDGNNFTDNLHAYHPDIVIHLASLSTSKEDKNSIISLINSNILFVSLLLNALQYSPVKLFINAGSFSEFHKNDTILDPTYFYSATKTASRFIINYFSEVNDFIFVNAVLYTVYGKQGEQKKIFDYMIDALSAQQAVAMGTGDQILDFIHIDDVIRFYLLLIESYRELPPQKYHEYHVGTGKGHTIHDLARVTYEVCHIHPNIAWNAIEPRKRDTLMATADTDLVFNDLGWKANIDLKTGIQKYLTYYGKKYAESI